MRAVSHTVVRTLGVPVERVFDVVVAEDVLPKVLHRRGPVPGVTGTRDLTGPWDQPGSERTVTLSDGHTARERVLIWQRPRVFEYLVDELTGPFGRLVDHAVGTWRFEPAPGGSRFRWTYSFQPPGVASGVLLIVPVRIAWARYMEQSATLCAGLALDSGPANR